MSKLHLANTDFEFELERENTLSLIDSLRQHPILLQLQFLPFLMEAPEDFVYVTDDPGDEYWESLPWKVPQRLLFDQSTSEAKHLEVWGASEVVSTWATDRALKYEIPSKQVVASVHNKLYTFTHSPQLPGSALLSDEKQLLEWLDANTGRKVLKTGFGVSARGHLIVDPKKPPKRLRAFCEREWKQGRPLIGEPWVRRLADFSTQWEVTRGGDVRFIGTTMLTNDEHGGYLGTQVGELSPVVQEHVEAHSSEARRLLKEVAAAGYFGPVGIDAMIYQGSKGPLLHPIVEINARKTMALVAIRMQERHYPEQAITITYGKREEGRMGLLPEHLGDVRFQRQLYVVPMV